MYAQCNIEVHLQNHACHGKAIRITYSECVSIGLVIQCKHNVILLSVTCLAPSHFYTLSHRQHNVGKKLLMCVLIFSTIQTIHTIKPTNTVKCHCNECQYNEMFRIAKLFLGPFPFPYLMCVKTFHFNEFRTFSITN